MTELLTAAQMRAIEQAAIASGEVTGLELMERAGRGVVDAVFAEWPELAASSHRAVVLCGPGNNGGDGFVVARLLKEWGWEVEVFLYGDPEKLPPDARVNYERWFEIGNVNTLMEGPDAEDRELGWELLVSDLAIDALFGTGLTRPIPKFPPLREFMSTAFGNNYTGSQTEERPRVVAIDIPSGLCSDSGKMLRPLLKVRNRDHFADLTVAFHQPKLGQLIESGRRHCGNVRVADIGLPKGTLPNVVKLTEATTNLAKIGAGYKYTHGHALILSGGPGRSGAARLAARGALRIGAGLVTLGVPPAAQSEVAAQVTAIMLARVADADALEAVLNDPRINALCLGPGFGTGTREREILARVLGVGKMGEDHPSYGGSVVLDADALTLLGEDGELFSALHDRCVLTPHGGEFARLFPDIAQRLSDAPTIGPAYSKVDATRDAAKRAGCVVLFKGPDTVIADPSGNCAINSAHYERAAPWLATAGSGDVLAGFITGLLARGFAPMQAAETAAWLHVECARKFGPGLIAEDLPEMLPKVLTDLHP